MVRAMGTEGSSLRLPCLHNYTVYMHHLRSVNVCGDRFGCNWGKNCSSNPKAMEDATGGLVEVLEKLSKGLVEGMGIKVGFRSKGG